jgi:hypothetical protein
MRRAARTDDNQTAIVATLRKMGARVAVLSGLGNGCPDLMIRYAGRWQPVEVKDGAKPPSGRRLTDDEVEWWLAMCAPPCVVEDLAGCVALLAKMARERNGC